MSDENTGEVKREPRPVPPEGASQATRDGYDDCYKRYDSCLSAAGSSTAAQAACAVDLRKCLEGC